MTARARLAAAALLGSLLLAGPAEAGDNTPTFPTLTPGDVESIPVPLIESLDPLDQSHLYVIPDRPPPQVVIVHIDKTGEETFEGTIDLPAGTTPSDLWWDFDGFLHIITREGRTFEYCPDCDELIETLPLVAGIDFPGDAAAGYKTDVLGDYGSGSSGSLWYGKGFESELPLQGVRPGAIDQMPYGRLKQGHQLAGFVTFPEGTANLLLFSDAARPSQINEYAGPSGVSQISGLALSQLNLTPGFGKPTTFPLFVSSPNSGNVYGAPIQWQKGAAATWQPISSTPLGIPSSIDANCMFLVVGDYANDTVSTFKIDPPKSAECDNIVDLIFGVDSESRLKIKAQFAAYANMVGRETIAFDTAGHKATASATSKVRLKAGRVTKATVDFSASETEAIADAIGDAGKLKGKATLKLHNKAQQKVKVTQALTLKATRDRSLKVR